MLIKSDFELGYCIDTLGLPNKIKLGRSPRGAWVNKYKVNANLI